MPGTVPERLDPLERDRWQGRLDQLAREHRVPGATLAVHRVRGPQEQLVEVATGVLSTATGVPVTPGSVFQIGSVTKVWTTTLVMQLVDEGLLDLDAPLAEVLPGVRLGEPDVSGEVTVRQLLSHTSGIDGDVFTDTGRGDDVLQSYAASLAGAQQVHRPGAVFSYCNTGFVLAGRLVEVLRGASWDAVLRDRLVAPLGLRTTSTLPEEAILHRVAVGHTDTRGAADGGRDGGSDGGTGVPTLRPVQTWMLPRSLGPAGLVNASAADVTRFAALHLRGGVTADGTRLLSQASVSAMQAEQVRLPEGCSTGDSWGLGWELSGGDGRRLYGHDGATLGQSAFLRVLPSQGLAVALLTNGGDAGDLHRALFREVFAELAGVVLPDGPRPAPQPADAVPVGYAGTYARSSVRNEVVVRDGRLVLRVTPLGDVADLTGGTVVELDLHPVRPGLFVVRRPGEKAWRSVSFTRLADGSRLMHHGVRASPLRPPLSG